MLHMIQFSAPIKTSYDPARETCSPVLVIADDMDFQVSVTNRGVPCIIFEYNKFRKYRELKSGNISWRCTKTPCGALLETDKNVSIIVNFQSEHKHEAVPEGQLNRDAVRVQCKRKALDDNSLRPSKIIRKELMNADSTGFLLKDIKSVRKAIYRTRRKTVPIVPRTRPEAIQQIQKLELKTSNGDQFTFIDQECEMVVITCKANLEFLCKFCVQVLADGTFSYAPKHFTQMYTIHGYQNGHYIPLVFSFLPSKSTSCYLQLWSYVKRLFWDLCNLTLSLQVIHLDFEASAIEAVRATFPGCTVKGCRFHLGQAWFRKISSLFGLRSEYVDPKSEIGKWLKTFFGLHFLAPEDVEEGFLDIFSEAPDNASAIAFSDYVLESYVAENAKFSPTLWAEHPSQDPHTTNGAEAFHRHYNSEFFSSHPNVHNVLAVLQEIQTETPLKIKGSMGPNKVLRKKDVERQRFKEETVARFRSGELTRLQYLKKMGFRFHGKKL